MEHITESKTMKIKQQRESKPPISPVTGAGPDITELRHGSKCIYASADLTLDYKCARFKYGCISLHKGFLRTKQRAARQRHGSRVWWEGPC